jgi:hypothetical protein
VIRLPEPKYPAVRLGLAPGELAYTADQMHAYAAARVAEAVAAERERCANEAEHWQKISTTPGHACGQYIAAAIRAGSAGGEG